MQTARLVFTQALARGDTKATACLYADDGRVLAPAGELIAGRGEIEAYWRAGVELGLTAVELEVVELQPATPVAIELGRYALAFSGQGDRRIADRGTYLALHRLEADGSWRRAVDVFNPDR